MRARSWSMLDTPPCQAPCSRSAACRAFSIAPACGKFMSSKAPPSTSNEVGRQGDPGRETSHGPHTKHPACSPLVIPLATMFGRDYSCLIAKA